jgi:porin
MWRARVTVALMIVAEAVAAAGSTPFAPARSGVVISYGGQAAANISGGQQAGGAYAGRVILSARFDVESTLGGELELMVTARHGHELSEEAIGNNTSVQEIYGPHETNLALVAYRRSYLDQRLELEAGRLVANTAFLSSPLYCHFQSNALCPCPASVFRASNFTFFPAPSWGLRAKAWLTDSWYLHGGAYEVNPEQRRATSDGLNWSTSGMTGVIAPFEVGYRNRSHEDELLTHVRLGGWRDTSDYADPSRDETGGLALLTGRPHATRAGRSGVFVQFEKALVRAPLGSQRGLMLFGAALKATAGRALEDRLVALGMVQTGTFAGRDADSFAIALTDRRFSRWAMEQVRAGRAFVGGDVAPHRHQYIAELSYGLQLREGVRVTPNLQYIGHPDQISNPFRPRNTPDALVLGLKFTIDHPLVDR